jgi:hypothetical protein
MKREKLNQDMHDYSQHFDEPSLWHKLSQGALDAGCRVVELAHQKLREYFGDQPETDDDGSQPTPSAP